MSTPEPNRASLVVDKDGDIWRYAGHNWVCQVDLSEGPWDETLAFLGPVSVYGPPALDCQATDLIGLRERIERRLTGILSTPDRTSVVGVLGAEFNERSCSSGTATGRWCPVEAPHPLLRLADPPPRCPESSSSCAWSTTPVSPARE